ncbi:MAG TPA: hypothetical protein PKU97_24555, partial [Kofleriaceae bacterium]|nr:hypothetical protein [Kofleriaceae bacterium]
MSSSTAPSCSGDLRAAEHAAELRRLVEATRDPWFLLALAQEHALAQQRAGAADLAEAALRASLASCDERRWAHRCAQLALHLAALTMDQGKYAEAEQQAGAALRSFRAAGADELEDNALAALAKARHLRGRM